ncbi:MULTISPECIES: crotonyl-CoA carboxylase/reductase [Streptomyces]|uniref:Crotonyl-CoA carboxylase/reductase n=1 Tax=Streptomyces venezuelae TaxID=54571 RepID=A0A5P2BNY0_STRVZ|nr:MULTISPECIES: crotonyl-CoA carboxylase/reductase [Streptomyces]NEA03575.1 crotonyl-CoA carboxylase/reductase [Streptomyces sp. SID10116]MYY82168.1 crotonyl-CoA carboxylase/reductase [Streptomyces sp. SID335]MYZ12570.1 crotonyl-CoA carboxylase/reductase [Streptomyces sp. SID337]NDZ86716.1 crotonyl-CoA carboxylase/reductase [Streptomyces sp. SID10115]NEB46689.1 crotonyl-CoA carboxylase/reductase [Streptomyces sp. SID339]
MDELSAAVIAGASPDVLESLPVPAEYNAAHLRAEDVGIFSGVEDKDVRKTIHLGRVPMPELAPDEVLVAVMAAAMNYNTIWSATFEPLPTFNFLRHYGKQGGWAARHDQPYHVLGSDAAGVIVRVGDGVRNWKVGDHVAVATAHVDDQEPLTQHDGMLGHEQRAWGFETNFGGLADYAVVRASQLLPKAAHLTWEEAASNPLCAGTAYRMLVSERGANMRQGDVVLVWGAAGGLGGYAVQFVRNGGGIPVGIVSSDEKAEVARKLGCELVIDRREIGEISADPDVTVAAGKRLGKIIRREVGEDPNIVFEHVGRETFGVSVFVARRGGTIVTCGSSTGYQHTFDNRYLWMRLKKIVGSHGANLYEQHQANRLIQRGKVMPMLSAVHPFQETGEAARAIQLNEHLGKVGVLCLSPAAGLGVTDPALRARIGEDRVAPLMTA